MTLDKDGQGKIYEKLTAAFNGMMSALFRQKGAQLDINVLASDEAQSFINAHASTLDKSFETVGMSDGMRQRLQQSDWIFSGIKTFHELNEAFPSLLDEDGNRKPFERFLNDVRKIDETYNRNYLRAEYGYVQASAEMAAKWEQYAEDGDRYNLQYRTAGDSKVRPEHAALNGITLPMSDPFWDSYYPPNGWGCRCTAAQVRKSKYPETPQADAMARGEAALAGDKKGIFRFNSGKQRKAVPDYNAYTIRRCRDCDVAQGKLNLAFVPDNELCAACKLVRQCYADKSKSESAILKKHYMHEMEPLLDIKHEKETNDKAIKVGFSTYGNKHLYSDTFSRSKVLTKDDLKDLGGLLEESTFIGEAELTHGRNDNIEHFYYYKAELHGRTVRLNVAKEVKRRMDGHIFIKYYLYSINDIKDESTEGGG